jgi:hypothetical protein
MTIITSSAAALGNGLGNGGQVTLYADGRKIGEGAIPSVPW